MGETTALAAEPGARAVDAGERLGGEHTAVPGREWKEWTDLDALKFFGLYKGVVLTIPYFFCDAPTGRRDVDVQRMQANAAFRLALPVEVHVAAVARGLERSLGGRSLACLHLRAEKTYEREFRESVTVAGVRALFAILEADSTLEASRHAIYIAAGRLPNRIRRLLEGELKYVVFQKDDFLPDTWLPPELSNPELLSYKAAAVDFGVCERAAAVFVGTRRSSFSVLLAGQRLLADPATPCLDYDSGPICPKPWQCSWYCAT